MRSVTSSAQEEAQSSPNRAEKQRLLVEAASRVLLRDGVAGCTARAVADESPLTKSALHYYFDDMNEIIDLAVEQMSLRYFDHLRTVGESIGDPTERFWTVVEEYLVPFERHTAMTLMWFDYWADATRRGQLESIRRMHDGIAELFGELLEPLEIDDPAERGHAFVSYMLGTVLQQTVRPLSFDELRPEVAAICRLPDDHGDASAAAF